VALTGVARKMRGAPTWAKLVRKLGSGDDRQGVAQVGWQRVLAVRTWASALMLMVRWHRSGRMNFLADQPVVVSIRSCTQRGLPS
jgi:hypothetical protein